MASLDAPSVDQLVIAATKLVDAIVEYRRPNDTRISTVPKKEPEASKPTFSVITAADLLDTDEEVLRLRDVVADPIGTALKRELHDLGQAIYDRVGSMNALTEIGDRIANADPSQYARRMSPLDSAWNGVGKDKDRWWS
ncbi:hypothetical protein [Sphingomonas sanguinis]|uniref:hypothetical protein n=1 Tax=Sphingomonas sanguinis TaxID=33051 RepID=UPI00128F7E53|nr:hypothetical protein [Sphingomonas sanguinis]